MSGSQFPVPPGNGHLDAVVFFLKKGRAREPPRSGPGKLGRFQHRGRRADIGDRGFRPQRGAEGAANHKKTGGRGRDASGGQGGGGGRRIKRRGQCQPGQGKTAYIFPAIFSVLPSQKKPLLLGPAWKAGENLPRPGPKRPLSSPRTREERKKMGQAWRSENSIRGFSFPPCLHTPQRWRGVPLGFSLGFKKAATWRPGDPANTTGLGRGSGSYS